MENSSNEQKRPITILVEGNIGSGKSAFLKYYTGFKDVEVVPYPMKKCPYNHACNDPTKWSAQAYTRAMYRLLEAHTQPTSAPVRIIERSLYSFMNCIIMYFYQRQAITKEVFEIFQQVLELAEKRDTFTADFTVYLRTEPLTVQERLRARAKPGDEVVSFDYMSQMHMLHDRWLLRSWPKHELVVLDANMTGENLLKEYKKFEDRLECKYNLKLSRT